jgi:hypothetical protein
MDEPTETGQPLFFASSDEEEETFVVGHASHVAESGPSEPASSSPAPEQVVLATNVTM